MKEIEEYEKDLASIRSVMERSGKFISLNGMSGILSGCYALMGAAAAYYLLSFPISPSDYRMYAANTEGFAWKLMLIGFVVLIASLGTGIALSDRKAKKAGSNLWNATSRQLFTNLAIPLITGGIFTMVLISRGYLDVAAAACLVFYGLALIHGSANTYDEIRYLGFLEIFIGLICAIYPGYELMCWSAGFGLLHIVYGAIMYNKYDR